MVDQLGALGEAVSDRTLVLHVIRGLNERFKNVGMHLRHGRPFPTFLEAKFDLLLEELTMEPQAPSQATALAASTTTQLGRSAGTGSGAPLLPRPRAAAAGAAARTAALDRQQQGGQPSSGQPAT